MQCNVSKCKNDKLKGEKKERSKLVQYINKKHTFKKNANWKYYTAHKGVWDHRELSYR
jgi:hypothetical protein